MALSQTLRIATSLLVSGAIGCATDPGGGQGDPLAYVLGVDAAENPVVVRVSGPRLLVTATVRARGDSQFNVGLALDASSGRLYWTYRGALAPTEWTVAELTDALVETRRASSSTIPGADSLGPDRPLVPLPQCGFLAMNFGAPQDTGAQRRGVLLLRVADFALAGRLNGFYLLGRRSASSCDLLVVRVGTGGIPGDNWIHAIDARALALGDSFPIPSNALFVAPGPQPSSVYLSVGDRLMLLDGSTQQVIAATTLGFRGQLGLGGPFARDAERGWVVVGDPGLYETGGGDTVLVLDASNLTRVGAFGVLRNAPAWRTTGEIATASQSGDILVLLKPAPFYAGGSGSLVLLRTGHPWPLAQSADVPAAWGLIAR